MDSEVEGVYCEVGVCRETGRAPFITRICCYRTFLELFFVL